MVIEILGSGKFLMFPENLKKVCPETPRKANMEKKVK
jgi:hypothetical protein